MADEDDDRGRRLREQEKAVPVGGLGRLVRSGRSAFALASTVLRRTEPDAAALDQLTSRLGELKGIGMKAGQILSFIDPSLPASTRRALAVLQRNAPASEFEAVQAVIRDAFGARAGTLLATLERQPFSVASIGQVHRARLGTDEVVVKVRHPGIAQALGADFSAALGGLRLANTILFGLAGGAKEMLEECRATFASECNFAREAEHQRVFREWLSDDGVVVPEVFDAWSSEAVLTTRYEPGEPLERYLARGPTQAQRDLAGTRLFRVMVGGFHQLGLLYADPHPGNFAFRGDDTVVVYDFGCVRRYEARHTRAFSAMAMALREGRRDELFRVAREFGFVLDGPERETVFERFARSFFAPMLVRAPSVISPEGAMDASQMLRDKRAMATLGLPPHLLFLLRLRFGLYAVLAALGSRADWGALESSFASPPAGKVSAW